MRVLRLVWRQSEAETPLVHAPDVRINQACVQSDVNAVKEAIEICQGLESPEHPLKGLRAELESRPGRAVTWWLAHLGDRPVGLAALVAADAFQGRRHSIAWLLVSPPARRLGIGRALVATALECALADGAKAIWVETRSDWAPAVAFWAAVGFRPSG